MEPYSLECLKGQFDFLVNLFKTTRGSAWGPVTLPVFKTGES
jgi:hypothetical protein